MDGQWLEVDVPNEFQATFFLRNEGSAIEMFIAVILPRLQALDKARCVSSADERLIAKKFIQCLKDRNLLPQRDFDLAYDGAGEWKDDNCFRSMLSRVRRKKADRLTDIKMLTSDKDKCPVVSDVRWHASDVPVPYHEKQKMYYISKKKMRSNLRNFRDRNQKASLYSTLFLDRVALNSKRLSAKARRINKVFTKKVRVQGVALNAMPSQAKLDAAYEDVRQKAASGEITTYCGDAGARMLEADRNRVVLTEQYGCIPLDRVLTITRAERLMDERSMSNPEECRNYICAVLSSIGVKHDGVMTGTDGVTRLDFRVILSEPVDPEQCREMAKEVRKHLRACHIFYFNSTKHITAKLNNLVVCVWKTVLWHVHRGMSGSEFISCYGWITRGSSPVWLFG